MKLNELKIACGGRQLKASQLSLNVNTKYNDTRSSEHHVNVHVPRHVLYCILCILI